MEFSNRPPLAPPELAKMKEEIEGEPRLRHQM